MAICAAVPLHVGPIPVAHIAITRFLNGPGGRGITHTFASFDTAQDWIDRQRPTFPRIGHERLGVTVLWADGEGFSGELRATHPANRGDCGNHLVEAIRQAITTGFAYGWHDPDRSLYGQVLQGHYELPGRAHRAPETAWTINDTLAYEASMGL